MERNGSGVELSFYSSSAAQKRVVELLGEQGKSRSQTENSQVEDINSLLGLFTAVAGTLGVVARNSGQTSDDEESTLLVNVCNLSNLNVYIRNIHLPDNARHIKPKNTFFPLSQGESGAVELSIKKSLEDEKRFKISLTIFGLWGCNSCELTFITAPYKNGHAIMPEQVYILAVDDDNHESPRKELVGRFGESVDRPVQLQLAEIKTIKQQSLFFDIGIIVLPGIVSRPAEQQNSDSSLNILFINGGR